MARPAEALLLEKLDALSQEVTALSERPHLASSACPLWWTGLAESLEELPGDLGFGLDGAAPHGRVTSLLEDVHAIAQSLRQGSEDQIQTAQILTPLLDELRGLVVAALTSDPS